MLVLAPLPPEGGVPTGDWTAAFRRQPGEEENGEGITM